MALLRPFQNYSLLPTIAPTVFRQTSFKITRCAYCIQRVSEVCYIAVNLSDICALVVVLVLNHISEDVRPAVIDIVTQSKSSSSQKRALLLKKGLLRSTADELEVLVDAGESIMSRRVHKYIY